MLAELRPINLLKLIFRMGLVQLSGGALKILTYFTLLCTLLRFSTFNVRRLTMIETMFFIERRDRVIHR